MAEDSCGNKDSATAPIPAPLVPQEQEAAATRRCHRWCGGSHSAQCFSASRLKPRSTAASSPPLAHIRPHKSRRILQCSVVGVLPSWREPAAACRKAVWRSRRSRRNSGTTIGAFLCVAIPRLWIELGHGRSPHQAAAHVRTCAGLSVKAQHESRAAATCASPCAAEPR